MEDFNYFKVPPKKDAVKMNYLKRYKNIMYVYLLGVVKLLLT